MERQGSRDKHESMTTSRITDKQNNAVNKHGKLEQQEASTRTQQAETQNNTQTSTNTHKR